MKRDLRKTDIEVDHIIAYAHCRNGIRFYRVTSIPDSKSGVNAQPIDRETLEPIEGRRIVWLPYCHETLVIGYGNGLYGEVK